MLRVPTRRSAGVSSSGREKSITFSGFPLFMRVRLAVEKKFNVDVYLLP
jgi:hypothetical protein